MKAVIRVVAALFTGVLLAVAPLPAAGSAGVTEPAGLEQWLEAVDAALAAAASEAAAGRVVEARDLVIRTYLEHFERVEGYYGRGGAHATPELAELIAGAEQRFHALLRPASDGKEYGAGIAELAGTVVRIRRVALEAGVALNPEVPVVAGPVEAVRSEARTVEIRDILEDLAGAEAAFDAGNALTALAGIDHAYLEGFEPIEPRLPAGAVGRIERLIHLSLRPQVAGSAESTMVRETFAALRAELLLADAALSAGGSFWFGAVNAFIIVVREGLEAVLLIAALLAYLGAIGAERRHRRQIFAGVGAGVVASIGTWIVARTVIPIGGANRELIEGATALMAVGVLLYVAHWLFQKTYIHDWKAYLRNQLGRAVSTGSSIAMAGLAFAAIYREGFETVLFYQALVFDAGAGAVLTGFFPGLVLITAIGIGIIRMGLRLPLKQVFAVTNTILLYLAFVFLGKGIYNLQEAGLFTPMPLGWMPDYEAIRLLFGVYPIAETLIAQGIYLLALGTTYTLYRQVAARRRAAAPSVQERAATA